MVYLSARNNLLQVCKAITMIVVLSQPMFSNKLPLEQLLTKND